MSDNKIKTIAAVGAVATTLGIGAVTNGLIEDGERTGGRFVTREEFNKYESSFQKRLWDLDGDTEQFIAKRLDEKDKEGYLDLIRIWRTATRSDSRGNVKKEEEE